ncbi:hypothetical protein V8C44DRAFT_317678 [Trichoderma aethiopicum]
MDENRSSSHVNIHIKHTLSLRHSLEQILNPQYISKRLCSRIGKSNTFPLAIQLHRRLRRRHPPGRRLSRNALLRYLPRPVPNLRPRTMRVSRQRVFSEIHVRGPTAVSRLRRGRLCERW